MTRDVPYCEDEYCDECGKRGAFDFMGDYVCADCLHKKQHKHKKVKHEQKQKKTKDKKQRT